MVSRSNGRRGPVVADAGELHGRKAPHFARSEARERSWRPTAFSDGLLGQFGEQGTSAQPLDRCRFDLRLLAQRHPSLVPREASDHGRASRFLRYTSVVRVLVASVAPGTLVLSVMRTSRTPVSSAIGEEQTVGVVQ